HHQRREAGEVRDRDPVLDLLLAGGGDQHLLLLGVVRRRTERLEIEIHFLERERNVLVRLAFDLDFELIVVQPRRHDDLLGDHGAGRHRHRDMLGARAKALVRAFHRIGRLLEVADVAVDHRIANERFDGIALDSVRASAGFDGLSPLMWFRFLALPLALLAGLAVAAVLAVALVVALAYPNLPSLEALTEYQPKIPLRIYSAEGVLIGEFGEERRSVVSIEEVPDALKHAILAAEDERFYEHPGIDYVGVLRAAYANLVAGGRRQGASTITMQVARNFFLSSEKTATRKLYEVLLAFKIEHSLTKDQILELYVNQIYLGQRAYGFAAAAQIYFGKSLEQLSLAETAMLAGLPKAPSMYNPVANLQRAKQRQRYV